MVLMPQAREQLRRQGGTVPRSFSLCAYVDVRDLAVVYRQALAVPLTGHQVAFVVADDSSCPEPLCDLLPRLLPAIGDKARGLTGHQPGVSNQRAKRLLNWQPTHSWRDDEADDQGGQLDQGGQ
jgi:hypothetical protein